MDSTAEASYQRYRRYREALEDFSEHSPRTILARTRWEKGLATCETLQKKYLAETGLFFRPFGGTPATEANRLKSRQPFPAPGKPKPLPATPPRA